MAKLNKLVFTLSDKKEISLSNADALELYNELNKIFGKLTITSPATSQTFNFDNVDPPWYPNDNSYFSFGGAITGSMASDTITITNPYPNDYSCTTTLPTKQYCKCKQG
jgi:hypothetical protein